MTPCPTTAPEEPKKAEPEWIEFTATAYCSCSKCCGKWAINRPLDEDGNEIVYTASGKVAKQGYTIAADTSVLPFGTLVEVQGYGIYEVQDIGSGVNGKHIDVYFNDHQEALNFGIKTVKCRVVG